MEGKSSNGLMRLEKTEVNINTQGLTLRDSGLMRLEKTRVNINTQGLTLKDSYRENRS